MEVPILILLKLRISLSRMNRYQFELNQIVYAKVIGFDWWPGIIKEYPGNRKSKQGKDCYRVDYIGDKRYSYLTEHRIKPFDPNKVKFYHTRKKRALNLALNAAINISKGAQSYEDYVRGVGKSTTKKHDDESKLLNRKRKQSTSINSKSNDNRIGKSKLVNQKLFLISKPNSIADNEIEPYTAESTASMSLKQISLKIIENNEVSNDSETSILMKYIKTLSIKPEIPIFKADSNHINPFLVKSEEHEFFDECPNSNFKLLKYSQKSPILNSGELFLDSCSESLHEEEEILISKNTTLNNYTLQINCKEDEDQKIFHIKRSCIKNETGHFDTSITPEGLIIATDGSIPKSNNLTLLTNANLKEDIKIQSSNTKMQRQNRSNENTSDMLFYKYLELSSLSQSKKLMNSLSNQDKNKSIVKSIEYNINRDDILGEESFAYSTHSELNLNENPENAAINASCRNHGRSLSISKLDIGQILNKDLVELSKLNFEHILKKDFFTINENEKYSSELSNFSRIFRSIIDKFETLLSTGDYTEDIKNLYQVMKEAQDFLSINAEIQEISCKLKPREVASLLSLFEIFFHTSFLLDRKKDLNSSSYQEFSNPETKWVNRGKYLKSKQKPIDFIKNENDSTLDIKSEDNFTYFTEDKYGLEGKIKKEESSDLLKHEESEKTNISNNEDIIPWTNFPYTTNIKNCYMILKDLGISGFGSPEEFSFKLRNDILITNMIEELKKTLPKVSSKGVSYLTEIFKPISVSQLIMNIL